MFLRKRNCTNRHSIRAWIMRTLYFLHKYYFPAFLWAIIFLFLGCTLLFTVSRRNARAMTSDQMISLSALSHTRDWHLRGKAGDQFWKFAEKRRSLTRVTEFLLKRDLANKFAKNVRSSRGSRSIMYIIGPRCHIIIAHTISIVQGINEQLIRIGKLTLVRLWETIARSMIDQTADNI